MLAAQSVVNVLFLSYYHLFHSFHLWEASFFAGAMVSFKFYVFGLVFSILFAAQEAFAYHYTARLSARLTQPVKRELSLNTASSRHSTTNLTEADIPAACTDSCSTNAINAIQTCTVEACTCGDTTDQAIGTCMTCVVDQGIITAELGDAVHKQYGTTCAHRGVVLSSANDAASLRTGFLALPLILGAAALSLF